MGGGNRVRTNYFYSGLANAACVLNFSLKTNSLALYTAYILSIFSRALDNAFGLVQIY